jgi:glycerol-3-phosphate acyltransferase PlsY
MFIALIIAGYLIGSIPIAWLVTRLHHGADLRALGSGNVGVLNTALSVHRWSGLLVFISEIAKGLFAVRLAQAMDGSEPAIGFTILAAIAGTRWPIWLRGQGGRGNTAAVAALALISPLALAILLVIVLAARFVSHSNFVAARLTLLALPFVLGIVMTSWWMLLTGACFSLMFLSTHRPESDDHLLLKARWPSLWAFLTAPERK